ncbi:MAG: S8 family serine peptidase, partial [Candidatus Thermoplasmatota archaeon]
MAEEIQKFIAFILVSLLVFSYFSVVGSGVQSSKEVSKEIVVIKGVEEDKLRTYDVDIIDEYGRYTLVEINSAEIGELKEEGINVKELPGRTEISVKGHTFDVLDGQPDLDPELKIDGYRSDEEGLYVIHMLGPVNPEWRETLEEEGVEIINYVPNYAYEARMTPEEAERVEGLSFVDWVGIYQPEFKLAENLEPGLVDIKLAGKAGKETLNEIGSKTGFLSLTDLSKKRTSLTAEVRTEKDLLELAKMNEVYYISNQAENRLHDEVATQIIGGGAWIWDSDDNASTPYRGISDHGALVNQLGWTGKNETVAVADTGINPDHQDFQNRVIGGHYWEGSTWEDDHGHGSHVAGSVAGNTYNGTNTTLDSLEDLGPY